MTTKTLKFSMTDKAPAVYSYLKSLSAYGKLHAVKGLVTFVDGKVYSVVEIYLNEGEPYIGFTLSSGGSIRWHYNEFPDKEMTVNISVEVEKTSSWVGILNVVLLPWTLLQNVLGFFVYFFLMARYSSKTVKSYLGVSIHEIQSNKFGGISLGGWVMIGLRPTQEATQMSSQHEVGHTIQSLILGPLYLLVIGIPSYVMNLLTKFGVLKHENYYKRYTEAWADQLGKVKR